MAKTKYKYRANQHDGVNQSALDPGQYPAVIESALIKDNSAGTGELLELRFSVRAKDGKRAVWNTFNLSNPSEMAVEISMNQLASLCHAIGIEGFDDVGELEGADLTLDLGVQQSGPYKGRNEVRGYSAPAKGKGKAKAKRKGKSPVKGKGKGKNKRRQDEEVPF